MASKASAGHRDWQHAQKCPPLRRAATVMNFTAPLPFSVAHAVESKCCMCEVPGRSVEPAQRSLSVIAPSFDTPRTGGRPCSSESSYASDAGWSLELGPRANDRE